ncbi:MAG TPA: hypothetical protein VNT01_09395 [Symbiobacteriaceae bacterium]|nr:hypothetical protein [Symbiobacteriaceae bacterium]
MDSGPGSGWPAIMLSRLFGPRITVAVRVLGLVGGRMVQWEGPVRLKGPADLRTVLAAAGRGAGVDLLGALAAGAQPALLIDGCRQDLPVGLAATVPDGARVTWLLPMAGG